MATNSRYFKVKTIEQFKILKYININFMDNALELELIDDNTIRATDYKGAEIIFYYDYEQEKVKVGNRL